MARSCLTPTNSRTASATGPSLIETQSMAPTRIVSSSRRATRRLRRRGGTFTGSGGVAAFAGILTYWLSAFQSARKKFPADVSTGLRRAEVRTIPAENRLLSGPGGAAIQSGFVGAGFEG